MKVSAINKLSREDYPDAPNWFARVLDVLNNFMDQVLLALRGKLTFRDNLLNQVIDFEFTHGVQVPFLNQLGQKPEGIIPIVAQGQIISGHGMDYNQKNEILITINFAAGGTTKARCVVFVLGR